MKKDLISLIGTVAPAVAGILIPGSPLVGLGIKMLSQTLLNKPDGTLSEVEAELSNASPGTMVKLKEVEVEYKALDIQMAEVDAKDRANAREREIALKDNTTAILAWIYTVGYFLMVGWLVIKGLPKEALAVKDILLPLVGILSAAELSIINYYFGSSAGSAAKNKIMANLKG